MKSESSSKFAKGFFLATLGYELKNDRIIRHVLNLEASAITPKVDNRGRKAKENKFDEKLIEDHIETFQPTISHYRREHAPLTRYLPSDITIKSMYEDFKSKYSVMISYELYRKVVAKKKISFATLGNEECSLCESFVLHEKFTGNHSKQNLNRDCPECQSWQDHHEKYKTAREEYQKGAGKIDGLYFSANLQKVTYFLPFLIMEYFSFFFSLLGHYAAPLQHVQRNNFCTAHYCV